MGKGQELYKHAKTIIPGGTQLLSKRPEMFLPDLWPAYYSRAKGCEIWDLDGEKYIDASYMGIGACVLGYADDDVNSAVKDAIDNGSMATLNAPEEVELAEKMFELHPWAQMARYTRSGGEAMTVAVRIARASAKRDVVLFCGYHGWHDWYLAANLSDDKALDGHLLSGLSPHGTPRKLIGSSYPFNYNDAGQILDLAKKYKDETGVIVLESIRNDEPDKDFIEAISEIQRKYNVIVIVDEITAGFRLNNGGAHLKYNLKPDIAVFAKAISNGFPMGVIIGKRDVMNAGQDSFISSTYWTERIGPVSALAMIKKFVREDVSSHLIRTGKRINDEWLKAAKKHNIEIETGGIYPLGHFSFAHDKPLVLKTLFTQLMLEKGFLATTAFYVSYAHKEEHVKKYIDSLDESFISIAEAIKSGSPEKYLKGPVCHSGFKRLN